MMKRLASSLTPLLLLTFFAGCSFVGDSNDGSTDEIAFTVEQENYQPGSTVMATLTNGSDKEISYNLCFSRLERKQEGEWLPAGPQLTCQAYAKVMKPGGSDQYGVALADSLDLPLSDTYRIATDVNVGSNGEERMLTTDSFGFSVIVQQ